MSLLLSLSASFIMFYRFPFFIFFYVFVGVFYFVCFYCVLYLHFLNIHTWIGEKTNWHNARKSVKNDKELIEMFKHGCFVVFFSTPYFYQVLLLPFISFFTSFFLDVYIYILTLFFRAVEYFRLAYLGIKLAGLCLKMVTSMEFVCSPA